jgi:hypothetical protein
MFWRRWNAQAALLPVFFGVVVVQAVQDVVLEDFLKIAQRPAQGTMESRSSLYSYRSPSKKAEARGPPTRDMPVLEIGRSRTMLDVHQIKNRFRSGSDWMRVISVASFFRRYGETELAAHGERLFPR